MKAILVVELPNNCYDCQYCRFDARRYNFRGCVLTDTEVQDGTIDIRKETHSCCPFKQMPDKKEDTYAYWIARGCNDAESYINGWNDCIDEITGETEWK